MSDKHPVIVYTRALRQSPMRLSANRAANRLYDGARSKVLPVRTKGRAHRHPKRGSDVDARTALQPHPSPGDNR